MSMLISCMPNGRGKNVLIPIDEEGRRRKLTFRAKSLKWILLAKRWKKARKKGEGGNLSDRFLKGGRGNHKPSIMENFGQNINSPASRPKILLQVRSGHDVRTERREVRLS